MASTSKRIGTRAAQIQSPIIPIVGSLARSTPGTISLGQGVVSYGPPTMAIEKAMRYAEGDNHLYGPVIGVPALLDTIRLKLQRDNNIVVNDSQRAICVSAGSNMAFLQLVLAIADEGDEFIVTSPFYFNHEMALTMCGVQCTKVPTTPEFQLDVEAIAKAISPKTRAIVTISPNNPTGAVYPEDSLRAVNTLCQRHGLYHISDEAYEYFVYGDAKHFSPCSIPGSEGYTISLFSLSKTYGFAAWRVGYMVIPADLLPTIQKIQDTNVICAPVPSQYAAVGCLEVGPDYCKPHITELMAVRDLFLATLGGSRYSHLWKVWPCDGAFYIIIQLLGCSLVDMEVVTRLIQEFRVAVLPGSAFGLDNGCFFRISFGPLTMDTAAEGLRRLVDGLQAISSVRQTT